MSSSSASRKQDGSILFLIRSLEAGGAERQLTVLARGLHARGIPIVVCTFYPDGAFRKELEQAGITVIDLGKKGRWDVLPFLVRLVNMLRRHRPAVIYGFLPVANILAALMRPIIPGTRVVWGVRASNMALDHYDRLTCWVAILETRLAGRANVIVCNSGAGLRHHAQLGFPEDRMVVIPNGIDLNRFRFNAKSRRHVRAEWGIRENQILVGLVARLDPMKDHPSFLDAASRVALKHQHVHFVCVGEGPADYTADLKRQASVRGLADRIIWAGARDDMAAVYSALDIAASSSAFGEGFSNAIAEAMACERPCVVTDVGDSASIVGATGPVVSPADPQALAEGLSQLIDLTASERPALGAVARSRIKEEYGVDALASRTLQVLELDRCE
jgi:glycosyltransferase involved in cell wall biosynthesis